MGQVKTFFRSRYGFDTLSTVLLLLTVILDGVNLFPFIKDKNILALVAILPLILCIGRVFSANKLRREKENRIFLKMLAFFFRNDEMGSNAGKSEKKLFKFFQCPQCGQKVRVPRGKGKVEILCPSCSYKFVKKT